MKQIISIFTLILLFSVPIFSQNVLSGKIFDEDSNPLPGVIVILDNGKLFVSTDEFGNYSFKNLEEGTYDIKAEYIGFVNQTKTVYLKGNISIDFVLFENDLTELDKIIVNATRAGGKTPIAFTTVDKNEISRNNVGKDIPYILKTTPSMVISSDGGTGTGYTQMRIRGTDATGINVTLNGVPMNDPESHGVWWVDIPDFASSVDNIQIQRGVGTSTNGAGAFGASINLKSNKINTKPSFEIANSFGSFNTLKNTVKFGTGSINNHFVLDGRLSKISSDGFVDRAWADLKSFHITGTYYTNKTLLRLSVSSGVENTYQAWAGIPKDSLESNRTYNPYTYENEIDHYLQSYYQLYFVQKLTTSLHFESSAFLTTGNGYYEQFKEDEKFSDYGLQQFTVGNDTITSTDLIRRKWLDNKFYGLNYNLVYDREKFNFVFGGGWNKYDGDHFGKIIWMQYSGKYPIRKEWYRNLGVKSDLNNYIKMNYNFFEKLNLYGDFQYRVIDYSISGSDDNLEQIYQSHKYDFFNPKLGLLFQPNDNNNIYVSYSIAYREPSRTDFIDAPRGKTPEEEKLNDFEFGYKLAKTNYSFDVNFYYMNYDNQLIMTGELNDVGAAIVTNVKDSYRRGVELVFGAKILNVVDWNANLTLSQNKIENYTEYVDNWSYWDDPDNSELQIKNYLGQTDLAFSPAITANNVISVKFLKYFNADFTTQYVSRQYIDNTSSVERSLDPYLLNDFALRASFDTKIIRNINVAFSLNNIFAEQYETFAWVYSYYYEGERGVIDGYFPQAGRNFMISLGLKF